MGIVFFSMGIHLLSVMGEEGTMIDNLKEAHRKLQNTHGKVSPVETLAKSLNWVENDFECGYCRYRTTDPLVIEYIKISVECPSCQRYHAIWRMIG